MLLEIFIQLSLGACISMALFFATWIPVVKYKNGALADITWSYGFLFLFIFYAAMNEGWLPRKVLLGVMVALWSLRLTYYLSKRTFQHLHDEDTRYKALRESSKIPEKLYFLWIFFCQALLQAVVTLPFVISCLDAESSFKITEIIAVLVFLPGFVGEALADKQLSDFKNSNANSSCSVCKTGLWKYSRHPNYFFEWVIWLSFFIYACASPSGLLAIFSPLIMLQMLLNVSGVKFSETVSVGSRGEAYRKYQEETSAFFPWFPKRST